MGHLPPKSMENVGEKVAEYLNKMRNDKRFHVSLSSDMGPAHKLPIPENLTDTKMTFNTNFESTLTEDQFRKGLESSLHISEHSEEDKV